MKGGATFREKFGGHSELSDVRGLRGNQACRGGEWARAVSPKTERRASGETVGSLERRPVSL